MTLNHAAVIARYGFIALIALTLSLLCTYLVLSRRCRPALSRARVGAGTLHLVDDHAPFFVYLVPCLNEERVIAATVTRLNAMPGSFAVVVIDDGSEDSTSAVVESFVSERIWLFQRRMPDARRGKGAALNAAFAWLRESPIVDGIPHDSVIVVVVDADGRLQPSAQRIVTPMFRDPKVGAVQIGVRINNATNSFLARLQDIEFVVFTEIFQRARVRIGTVGLGGNGQFVRLSALESLDDEPWSDCLTEDLELGIRLHLNGWHGGYTGDTCVEQQGVTSFRRLIRQRTRWFQGHLQCLKHIPSILQSRLSFVAMSDLCWHLLSPILILLMSITSIPFLISGLVFVATHGTDTAQLLVRDPTGPIAFYAIAFAPSYVYAWIYRTKTPSIRWLRCIAYAHIFTLYGFLWIISGWLATGRVIKGHSSWTKTDRSAEVADPESEAVGAAA